MRVFVSFSSANREFVREFIARLELQQVSVWIYEGDEGELPATESLWAGLRRQVTSADAILAIITAESLQSEYTQFEVDVACQHRAEHPGSLMIIPLLDRALEQEARDAWPEPYRRLMGVEGERQDHAKYRVLDLDGTARIDDVIVDLCRDLGVQPYGILPENPTFPFMSRFSEEMRSRLAYRTDRDIGCYCRVIRLLTEFGRAIERGDSPRAAEVIRFITETLEFEYPHLDFYFPYIARAVAEMQCGRSEAAHRVLQSLIEDDHPMLDENAFGCLGQIAMDSHNVQAARELFERARSFDPDGPAIISHLTLIEAMEHGDADEALLRLESVDLSQVRSEHDRARLAVLKAHITVLARRNGRDRNSEMLIDNAIEEVSQLLEVGLAGEGAVQRFCAELCQPDQRARERARRHRLERAVSLLMRFRRDWTDIDTPRLLATMLSWQRRWAEATSILEELIETAPANRYLRVDLAQVLDAAGRDRKIVEQAYAAVLDRAVCGLPQSNDDVYHEGLANWMLGRRERAQYDFERSGYPEPFHYRYMTVG